MAKNKHEIDPKNDAGSLSIVREKGGLVTVAVRAGGNTLESKISIPWADWLVLREAGQ
jgi:hypothetical protein